MNARVACMVAVVAYALRASAAFGQHVDGAEPSSPQTAEPPQAAQTNASYGSLIDQGLEASAQRRWADAYRLFDQAHALEPNARTLRARGIAAYKQGQLQAAHEDLRAALAEQRHPLTEELVIAVRDLITRIEASLARVRLDVRPERARVLVDGIAAVPDGAGDLFVTAGSHRLRLVAQEYAPLERELVVGAGSVTEIVVELHPLAPIGTGKGVIAPPTLRSRAVSIAAFRPASTSSEPSTIGLWTSGGAAALFGVAAGAFWLAGAGEVDQVAADCRALRCLPPERERLIQQSDIGTYETLTTTSLVLSGTSLVAFGVIYWLRLRRDGSSAGLAPSPDARSVGIRF